MNRKIITFCAVILLILSCCYTSFAKESGSITVTLADQSQNQAIIGAKLRVYRVASVLTDADGDRVYDYTEPFNKLGVSITDLSLASKLDEFVVKHDLPFVEMITDANGLAVCNGLETGLYFVKQTGSVEGFAPCTSFLVTLPIEQNGEYVYDVNASPKTEVSKLTSVTIKKVWNTDASTAATDSVTVELLKNGTVVKTAVLNAANDWQITYIDIPESDAYEIREVNVPKGFTATYSKQQDIFIVTNTSTLVQTGQLAWPVPVLAVGGMLLIAAGVALLQKKSKSNA